MLVLHTYHNTKAVLLYICCIKRDEKKKSVSYLSRDPLVHVVPCVSSGLILFILCPVCVHNFDTTQVGAPTSDSATTLENAGSAFVVFGWKDGGEGTAWGKSVDLSTLDGSNGFAILGSTAGGHFGCVPVFDCVHRNIFAAGRAACADLTCRCLALAYGGSLRWGLDFAWCRWQANPWEHCARVAVVLLFGALLFYELRVKLAADGTRDRNTLRQKRKLFRRLDAKLVSLGSFCA